MPAAAVIPALLENIYVVAVKGRVVDCIALRLAAFRGNPCAAGVRNFRVGARVGETQREPPNETVRKGECSNLHLRAEYLHHRIFPNPADFV